VLKHVRSIGGTGLYGLYIDRDRLWRGNNAWFAADADASLIHATNDAERIYTVRHGSGRDSRDRLCYSIKRTT